MISKRILSVALACSMLLAMSAQAFAAVEVKPGANSTIKGEATVTVPTVIVSAPANLNFVIDPLNVGQKGQVAPGGADDTAVLIENLSAVPVDLMVVSAKGTEAGGAKLVEDLPPTATTTENAAYLFVRAMRAEPTEISGTEALTRIAADSARKFTAAAPTKAGDVLLKKDVTAVPESLLFSFTQGKEDASNAGDYLADPAGGRALIYIAGSVAPKPTTAWAAADKITADVVLKVVPKAAVAPTP